MGKGRGWIDPEREREAIIKCLPEWSFIGQRSELGAFRTARFRGMTSRSATTGRIGLSFDVEGGVVRLAVDDKGAQALIRGLEGYLAGCGIQSSISSGIPSSDGSPDAGHVVTPVASSSAAVDGSRYAPRSSSSISTCQSPSCRSEIQKVPTRVRWLNAITRFIARCLLLDQHASGRAFGVASKPEPQVLVIADACSDALRQAWKEAGGAGGAMVQLPVGVPAVHAHRSLADITIRLKPDGVVDVVSTCAGQPDAQYALMLDVRAPREVEKLLGELRARLDGAARG